MTVPITGALILGLGAWFFLFWPKMLYPATIVALPFTATAVVNFGWANAVGGGGRSVIVWQFFFVLWICREAISIVPPWHRRGWFSTTRARYGLFVFLAAVVLSLSVPLVSNGTTWVLKPRTMTHALIPLQMGSFDLTQTAYIAFGILFAVLVAAENSNSRKLFRTLKVYVASCTFAAAWGILELACNVTGHQYPAAIFNTSENISAAGYTETVWFGNVSGLSRISSVAQEPSVLARTLLIALVAIVVCLRLRRPILSMKWDIFALCLITTTLLASTSSTAYFGIPMGLLVAALALSRAGKPVKLYLVMTGAVLAVGVLVAVLVPFVGSVLTALVVNKFQTGSGAARLDSVILAASDFIRYPLLGVGWHNVACWDLVFLILANTGVVGLIAFAYFVFPVLRRLWALAAKEKPAAVVFLAIFVFILLLTEATGLTYVAGYAWLVFGLGAGAVSAALGERAHTDTIRVRASGSFER